MFTTFLFYLLSVILIFASLMVIISRKPVNSILFLIVAFFAISGHYILLNAQFLAIVNIIIYAGAIMVLFLFAVMLLNMNKETEPRKSLILQIIAVITGCLFALTLIGSMKAADHAVMRDSSLNTIGLIQNLGKTLFTEFLLPFELTSVLFLTAVVGILMIGKKE